MYYKILLIVLFMEYMRPDTYLPLIGALKINVLLPLLLFAVCFVSSDTEKLSNFQILKTGPARLLLLLLGLTVLSVMTADVTLYSFRVYKAVLGYVFLFWIIAKEVNSLNRLKGIMVLLVFVHIGLVALNPNVITHPETRSYIQGVTFLGDGNDFALSVVITFPLALFLVQDAGSKWMRYLYMFGLVTMVLTLIGTQSRGATLAFACVLFYMWWRSRRKGLGLVVIGMLIATVAIYAPPQYFERVESIAEYETEGSAQGRITAWKAAARMAAEYPLTGVGAGHFPMEYAIDFKPPEFEGRNFPWKTAHSIYFLALGELGIPGFIFILSAVFGNLWIWDRRIKKLGEYPDDADAIRVRKLLITINSALIGYGFTGAFLSALYYPHIFVLMGLFVSAAHIISTKFSNVELGLNRRTTEIEGISTRLKGSMNP